MELFLDLVGIVLYQGVVAVERLTQGQPSPQEVFADKSKVQASTTMLAPSFATFLTLIADTAGHLGYGNR